jgi:hypothetical protein
MYGIGKTEKILEKKNRPLDSLVDCVHLCNTVSKGIWKMATYVAGLPDGLFWVTFGGS